MMNVGMLSVVMLIVVAPLFQFFSPKNRIDLDGLASKYRHGPNVIKILTDIIFRISAVS